MVYSEYRCEACGLWMPSWWGRECRRCEKAKAEELARLKSVGGRLTPVARISAAAPLGGRRI